MTRTTGLSTHCLRTPRCPRPCSKCGVSLAGTTAHLPLFAAGIYCAPDVVRRAIQPQRRRKP
jgi:hypothetical protein